MWVLKSPPVLVPWRNWDEWTHVSPLLLLFLSHSQVCTLLFSRDLEALAKGLKIGSMWRARVPHLTPYIDATLYITECMQIGRDGRD
jgi:hypothetical protein